MTSEISSKKGLIENILILGRGYIGNYLSKFLESEYSVKIVSFSELDYSDQKELSKFLLNNNIDYVINCSGFTGRPNVDEAESKKELCWQLNTVNPTEVVKTCNKIGVRCIHISSGCIYNGYEKVFTENDTPNFGMFDESSFYSKSKHAFETLTRGFDLKILRLRMPICNDLTNPRNYLKKIMDYPNLIDMVNSKTYVPDLCGFIHALIKSDVSWAGQDIYNVVNGNPLTTYDIIEHLETSNKGRWPKFSPKTWVKLSDLKINAPRSNCLLDNTKASEIFKFHTEEEVLDMVIDYNNGNSKV